MQELMTLRYSVALTDRIYGDLSQGLYELRMWIGTPVPGCAKVQSDLGSRGTIFVSW